MKKLQKIALALLFVMIFSVGCVKNTGFSVETGRMETKGEEIDYTVVAKEDIPQTLAEEIEAQKEQGFRLSYTDEGYLYLARGYGKQPPGSSIQVRSVTGDADTIYYETTLLGPDNVQPQDETDTFPYIVVKIEGNGQNVVFR